MYCVESEITQRDQSIITYSSSQANSLKPISDWFKAWAAATPEISVKTVKLWALLTVNGQRLVERVCGVTSVHWGRGAVVVDGMAHTFHHPLVSWGSLVGHI